MKRMTWVLALLVGLGWTLPTLAVESGECPGMKGETAGKCGHCSHGKGGPHGHRYGREGHGDMFLDYTKELELTDKQVAQLNKLRVDRREKADNLQDKIATLRKDLMETSQADKPDTKKIASLSKQIGELKGEMIKLTTMSLLEARNTLTEAQRKKLHEMLSQGMREDDED